MSTHSSRPRISFVVSMSLMAVAIVGGQSSVADLPFEANLDLLKPPDNIHFGEVAGVATNSKGNIFVYTRTGASHASLGGSRTFYKSGSRLFQFDAAGKFVKEIGVGVYGLNVAQAVRVDPQDNIWVVDQGSSNVIKFDPEGRILLVLSRKPEAIAVRPGALPGGGARGAGGEAARSGGPDAARGGPPSESGRGGGGPDAGRAGQGGGRGPAGPPGSGIPGDSFTRTAGVAWDRAGNIYVADGAGNGVGNARVAKFDKDGHFIKSWGYRGTEAGQFNALSGIALDAQDNVYVADAGNQRIQVFDRDGNPKTQMANIGMPRAICISPGAHQYLFSSNSNETETLDNGEIYKLELDGRIVGKFGRAGKLAKEFSIVNAIDCRNESDLLIGELGNWRVQKVTLRASGR